MIDTYIHPQQHNSFVSGFTLGVVAGATGYFLFGTKKGTVLRKQLIAEWEVARVKLAQEGVIEHEEITLRQFLFNTLHRFYDQPLTPTQVMRSQGLLAPRKTATKSASSSTSAPRTRKETSQKFKGV